MNNYDFGKLLSPLRFEQITRDLLSKQYGIFENFAEGRDNGIDFRYSESNSGSILIVQCKRYNNVGNLISTLKKEAEKMLRLDFTTYLLVTSLNLTDQNKKKVIENFDGRVKAEDIITGNDLNYLLGLESNHHIEFKYPELWMKSINIHQKIFHIGFLDHSKFISEKILSSLKNFVPHRHFTEAIDHLNKSNVLIIAGNPGIGKTTLSYALISHYIYSEGVELIDISYRKIEEAESFIGRERSTIFFIDDFLGKIKLDKDDNYSQLLYFFIERIEKSNHKLIITSREYILHRASKELSGINSINRYLTKNVIEIKSFTRKIRAEILLNHLVNSDLPNSKIDNFLQSDYKRIIDHENYSPRIIEELTKAKLVANIDPADYYDYFLSSLRNPLLVWENVYSNLPNKLYKLVIITAFLIEGRLPVSRLEEAIHAVIKQSREYHAFSYDDFEYVVKELEGTFFTFQDGYDEDIEEEYTLVEFSNPSVIDFIDNFIWDKKYWLDLIIENAIYYEQLFNPDLLMVIDDDEALRESFRKRILKDFMNLENANIGYFQFEVEGEIFDCWTQGRHYYYLARVCEVSSFREDRDVLNFVKKEIFRYPFDITEDMSEKHCFCSAAEVLLEAKVIKGSAAIEHYMHMPPESIKELVCFEYMTRKCSKESRKRIWKNEPFGEEVDKLFLVKIDFLKKSKSFLDLADLLDDYSQLKSLFPLRETAKRIGELEDEKLWEEAIEELKKNEPADEPVEQKVNEYFDVDDRFIENIFESIKTDEPDIEEE